MNHNPVCKDLLSHQLNYRPTILQLAVKKLLNFSVSFLDLDGLYLYCSVFFNGFLQYGKQFFFSKLDLHRLYQNRDFGVLNTMQ